MPDPTPEPELTFEQALEQVERIVERIESGEVGLERSIAEYERGMALLNRCRGLLQKAELKVEEVTARMHDEAREPPAGGSSATDGGNASNGGNAGGAGGSSGGPPAEDPPF